MTQDHGHVPFKYVYSKLTIYHNLKIDLQWYRSIHHCIACRLASKTPDKAVKCGAFHHGFCTAPLFLPRPASTESVVAVNCKEPVPVAVVLKPGSVVHKPKQLQNQVISREPTFKDLQVEVDRIEPEDNSPNVIVLEKLSPVKTDVITPPQLVKDKDITVPSREDLSPRHTDLTVQRENVKNIDAKVVPRPKSTSPRTQSVHSRSSIHIPTFYFPMGKPTPTEDPESVLQRVAEEFSKFDGGKVYKNQMTVVTKACRLPLYWRTALFQASGGDKQGYITVQMYTAMWRKLVLGCHDDAARFVWLLAKDSQKYLEHEDFLPIVQDVVDTHPGLGFLQEAPEFHSRYVNTVIARIFYTVNKSWSAKITLPELRQSNFLQTLAQLEDEEDINQITDYFSYEHFYVIYCKFWELDKDHDLLIDKTDLSRHNDHAISSRAIDRIFSGAVTRGKTQKEGKMTYPEFVWFLLSEEDKRHPRSVEYWFRVMDLDGDGVLSMYEMEYFYEEQMQKMEALGIEKLPFQDALCQMLDLVKPKREGQITLSDLKACKLTNIFYDTFFNLDKFLDHEQKDPFANVRDLELDGPEPSDWEKYAADEYEALVAEEGAAEQDVHYEDDFEADEDGLQEDVIHLNPQSFEPRPRATTPEDDIYDFTPHDLGY